jgi:hypothetical protein
MDKIGIYQIKRKNNPIRKFGFIVPGMGRWDNLFIGLNHEFYNFIENKIHMNNNFNPNNNILIIGLAESGLIPAYLFYKFFKKKYNNYDIEISLSSRENDYINDNNDNIFVFYEDHVTTQYPKHFLKLINKNLYYSNIIIIDDEMTTGNTIMKLFDQIKHLSNNFFVFNYADVRENKINELYFDDKKLFLYSLMNAEQLNDINTNCVEIFSFNKNITKFDNYKNIIYLIGESIEEGIDEYINNYIYNNDTIIRLITHINWEIGIMIKSIYDLGCDINNKYYKYYNPIIPLNNTNNYIYYYSWQYPVVDKLEKLLLNLNSNINIIKIPSNGKKDIHNIIL